MRRTVWRVQLAITASLMVLLMVLLAPPSWTAGATPDHQVDWSAELDLAFTRDQVQQAGWDADAAGLESALTSRVRARGANIQVSRQTGADGGRSYRFSLSGKGDMQLVKQVLYDDLEPLGGLLGGPASITLSGAVSAGESVAITLDSNVSTGYTWQVDPLDGHVLAATGEVSLASKARLLGAPMTQTIRVQAVGSGTATVSLSYRRPWMNSEPATRRVKLQASRLATLTDLGNPAPLKGVEPSGGHTAPAQLRVASEPLPASFDWRDSGKMPKVRDQGGCGSCWAFATAGSFEPALMINKGFTTVNSSEQFLISCNREGWGCNGGWWAHDYEGLKPGKNDTQAGAVAESAFPYVAGDASCGGPYPHPYALENWYYVGDMWGVPPADAIKAAIYNYGPVSSAICVGNAFSNYRGGVFSTNEKSVCGASDVNHGVVITGWNDADNTWVIRNSWGSGWGENGYMRIKRGISNVGYAANYVVVPAEPGTCYALTTSVSPDGSGSVTANPAPNCNNGTQYTAGTTVKLSATPTGNYSFMNWSGDASGTANPLTVSMDRDKSIVANFSKPVITVQEDALEASYGSWQGMTDGIASGGAYRVSQTPDETVTFKFTGTSIRWITRKGPDQGQAQVSIDGVNRGIVDLYSATTARFGKVYNGLPNGAHTIVVKVLGTKNAASTGNNVVIDGFAVGTTVTQEDALAVKYSTWAGVRNSYASGGAYRMSALAGTVASFTFEGTGAGWVTDKCPGCGQADVYIDGSYKETADLYAPTWQYQVAIRYDGLAPGVHTIEIRALGTKNPAATNTKVIVDAFQYTE